MLTINDFNVPAVKTINRFSKQIFLDPAGETNNIDLLNYDSQTVGAGNIRVSTMNTPNNFFNSPIKINYTPMIKSLYMGRQHDFMGHEYEPLRVFPGKPEYYNGLIANVIEQKKLKEVDENGNNIYEYKYVGDLYDTPRETTLSIKKHPTKTVEVMTSTSMIGWGETFVDNESSNAVFVYKQGETITLHRLTSHQNEKITFTHPNLSIKKVQKVSNQVMIWFKSDTALNQFITINLDGTQYNASEGILPDNVTNLNVPEITDGTNLTEFVNVTPDSIRIISSNDGRVISEVSYTDFTGAISVDSSTKVFCDYKFRHIWIMSSSTNTYLRLINYLNEDDRSHMLSAHRDKVVEDKMLGTVYYYMGKGGPGNILTVSSDKVNLLTDISMRPRTNNYRTVNTQKMVLNSPIQSSIMRANSSTWSTGKVKTSFESPYFSKTFTDYFEKNVNETSLTENIVLSSKDTGLTYFSPMYIKNTDMTQTLPREYHLTVHDLGLFVYDINTIYINICKL